VNGSVIATDEQGLIDFTREIVRTPSLSKEEEKVATIIAVKMRDLGFDRVKIDSMFNVIGFIYGEDRTPELLFNGHIDTVPPSNIPDPFSGTITDGEKYGVHGMVLEGRGACDNKGAVASMIYAAAALRKRGVAFRKTFVMTAVAREEMANGEGILKVLGEEGVRAKMAVSGEATNMNVHIGHRGKLEFTVRVQGRTTHASNPGRGINAVYKMSDFIQDLRKDYVMPSHPVLGDCTFAVIDILSGPGRLGPITPDWCEIALDRRYLPEESAASVRAEIEALILRRKALDPDFQAVVELVKDFPPLYCPEEEPVVQLTRKARESIIGDPGKIDVWKFGVDGTFIQRSGIPCVGFGPGSELFAHTPHDHVPIEQLLMSCRVYAEIIKRACC
jgi:succinyl-diaminopimelate desuccinylase